MLCRERILYSYYRVGHRHKRNDRVAAIHIVELLVAFYFKNIRIVGAEERITILITHSVVLYIMDGVQNQFAQSVIDHVPVDTERTVRMSVLPHRKRGMFGVVGLTQQGVVRIILHYSVFIGSRIGLNRERFAHIHRNRLVDDIQVGRLHSDAADVIGYRRNQGRELSGDRVCANVDGVAVVAGSAPCRTADGIRTHGCYGHCLVVGHHIKGRTVRHLLHIQVVEVILRDKCQCGLADVVVTQAEADRLVAFNVSTNHPAGEVD